MKRLLPPRGAHIARALGTFVLALSLSLVSAADAAEEQAPPSSAGVSEQGPEKIVVPPSLSTPEQQAEEERTEQELSARKFNFEQLRSRIDGYWFKRKALLQQSLFDAAEEQLREILDLCRESGVERMPAYSAALVHEGDHFLREGNFNKARASYASALQLTPGFPPAHAGLAIAAWKSGEGVGSAIRHWLSATTSREEWLSLRSLANGSVMLVLAIGILLAGCSLALVLRYQRSFRHDVEESLMPRLSPAAASVAAVFLLLLPLLTWVLAPWTPAYWSAILFRYGRAREKILCLLLLVLFVLSGPLGRLSLSTSRLAADPTAQVLLESAEGSREPDAILALEELAVSNATDPLYPALLGGVYARGRFLGEAMEQFRRASELAPNDPRPVNNIGNIYFQIGRHAEASQAYRRAIEIDANFLPAYVNLYLARQSMFDFRQAEEALQQGRKIDANTIAALLEDRRGDAKAQEPIQTGVPPAEVWKLILARGAGNRSIMDTLRAGLRSPSSLAGGALIIAALLMSGLLGLRTAVSCVQCGRAFCKHCQADSDSPDYCAQCRSLLVKRETLQPSVRAQKLEEISRNGRRLARLSRGLSVALPGAGWIFDGWTIGGLLLLAGWCLLLTYVLLREVLLVPVVAPATGTTLLVPSLAAASLVWIGGNLRRRAAE